MAFIAHGSGLAKNPLAARIYTAASLADLAAGAGNSLTRIRNAAALIAHQSGAADNLLTAGIGNAAAFITNLPDAADNPLAEGIGNAAALIAHQSGGADNVLAAGIGNAAAARAH